MSIKISNVGSVVQIIMEKCGFAITKTLQIETMNMVRMDSQLYVTNIRTKSVIKIRSN